MKGVRKRSGSIENWEVLMELYWDFEWGEALTSFHSKVTVSVGGCLDQGGIFRR